MEAPRHPFEPDKLASFLPRRQVRRLTRNPASLNGPELEIFPAAVLFADVSGFSALADRLSRHGPAGAEELTAILTPVFERLIGCIDAAGGDVLKFGGDAVLAVWQATDADLPEAAARAAACGLAVSAALHNFQIGTGESISVHSGVGAGEISVALVGGQFQRWELLVTGAPLVQIGLASKYAARGEVVVAQHAWPLLGARARGTLLDSGHWRLDAVDSPPAHVPELPLCLSPESEAAVRSCLPRAVLARLSAGQDAWLAELRQVTVLFVNLPDLTESLPLRRAQAVMSAIQSALYRFEGSINQLGADDKGITLVAALGLPPLAHEDDARRGVQAAQAIQSSLRDLGLRYAIGITTGRVYCGTVGCARRCQYTMIGDVVNLAARLMQLASGDIFCDSATRHPAAAKMQFESLPPRKLKGKAEPVPVFRPCLQADEGASRRPMFGRQVERALLMEALSGLAAAKGNVFLIEGEPGIGKSRLLTDLRENAAIRRMKVLAGGADAVERSTPYHAWRALFSALFGLESGAPAEERQARFLARLGEQRHSAELAPLLNSVLRLDLPDTETTAAMSGQVRSANTLAFLLEVLRAACRTGPALLVMEDVHWLDSASWNLLFLALRELAAHTLIVLAARPLEETAPDEGKELQQWDGIRRIRLEQLESRHIAELIRERLGVSSVPDEVQTLIWHKAQGNPFFSEELALALRDAGALQIVEGQCRIGSGIDLQNIRLPDSVQGAIIGRLDRLPASQQLTLKVASVIGRGFALRILHDVYPIENERQELPRHLQMLADLGLTTLDTPEPESSWSFRHVITQEVAYNLMLFAQRRQLHRIVAEWYERTSATEAASLYPLLAHHWERAEDYEKAVEYSEKAGAQALRNGAYEEAITFIEGALAHSGRLSAEQPAERRARWERQLGEAYMGLGQLQAARLHTERALALWGYQLRTGKLELATSLLGQLLRQLWHRFVPARGRHSAEQEARLREVASAWERITDVAYYYGDVATGVHGLLTGLNLVYGLKPSPELARICSTTAVALAVCRRPGWGEAYIARAEQALEHAPDPASRRWCMEMWAMFRSSQGDWQPAETLFDAAFDLASRAGDWRRYEELLTQKAVMDLNRGHFLAAATGARELYETSRRRRHTQAQLWACCIWILSLHRLDRLEEAGDALEECLRLPNEEFGPLDRIWLLGVEMCPHWWAGRHDLARSRAAAASALIRRYRPCSNAHFEDHSALAAFWLELRAAGDRTAEVRQASAAAVKACARFAASFPFARPRALLLEGTWYWQEGKKEKAAARWAAGLAATERINVPFERGLLHLEIGRHLELGDTRRLEHLKSAAAIFETHGALSDLKRARPS